MDSLVVTGFRIGLLVLLWLFVFLAVRAMRRDSTKAVGSSGRSRSGRPSRKQPRAAAQRRGEPATRITIVEGPLAGSHMDISTIDELVLGRSEDCDFVLGDDYASSRHARVFRRGNHWFVEDLDSRNGTHLSGARIDQPERVDVGQDIRVGRTTVRLAS
ncbi:FHA domain-containing protein FhaB/FipA [Corynebacterium otitidis]|uniref:FHA domain-containing protein n=1 Tax=Corynebacterium otitidis ATCC 51513 TaxID=883169 RepID=I7LCI5_9CORY|nr:FHA domain-containing protein [Corynebacterium otitidis]EJZ81347.1 hypothetical protein HMPREF9719_01755 [Corynebacterium otitidis ATCC 51513]KKO83970.1 hypothetical protein AAV33_03590 [Corynebacterium otitidis]CCI83989.1 hypothetical protein BN46_1266 [Corynebacterium otitidis ATCC 51513]